LLQRARAKAQQTWENKTNMTSNQNDAIGNALLSPATPDEGSSLGSPTCCASNAVHDQRASIDGTDQSEQENSPVSYYAAGEGEVEAPKTLASLLDPEMAQRRALLRIRQKKKREDQEKEPKQARKHRDGSPDLGNDIVAEPKKPGPRKSTPPCDNQGCPRKTHAASIPNKTQQSHRRATAGLSAAEGRRRAALRLKEHKKKQMEKEKHRNLQNREISNIKKAERNQKILNSMERQKENVPPKEKNYDNPSRKLSSIYCSGKPLVEEVNQQNATVISKPGNKTTCLNFHPLVEEVDPGVLFSSGGDQEEDSLLFTSGGGENDRIAKKQDSPILASVQLHLSSISDISVEKGKDRYYYVVFEEIVDCSRSRKQYFVTHSRLGAENGLATVVDFPGDEFCLQNLAPHQANKNDDNLGDFRVLGNNPSSGDEGLFQGLVYSHLDHRDTKWNQPTLEARDSRHIVDPALLKIVEQYGDSLLGVATIDLRNDFKGNCERVNGRCTGLLESIIINEKGGVSGRLFIQLKFHSMHYY